MNTVLITRADLEDSWSTDRNRTSQKLIRWSLHHHRLILPIRLVPLIARTTVLPRPRVPPREPLVCWLFRKRSACSASSLRRSSSRRWRSISSSISISWARASLISSALASTRWRVSCKIQRWWVEPWQYSQKKETGELERSNTSVSPCQVASESNSRVCSVCARNFEYTSRSMLEFWAARWTL